MAQSIGGLQGISNFAMLLSLCTAESLKSKKIMYVGGKNYIFSSEIYDGRLTNESSVVTSCRTRDMK